MPSDKESESGICQECGKYIKYVRQHERLIHSIYVRPRPNSKVKTIVPAVPSQELVPVVRKIETNGKPSTFRQVEGFMIIEKDDGSIWMAEKIRD